MNATHTQTRIFDSLRQILSLYPGQFGGQSKHEIEAFFAFCREGMENDSEKLLATLLLKALNKKIRSESIDENIYTKRYEIPQIQLFGILIEKFPFVSISQNLCNRAIVDSMKGAEEVTLIDIGIGQGAQVTNIIGLASTLPGLKKLNVIGIEPFEDALGRAAAHIQICRTAVPFEISFSGIHDFAENVNFSALPNVSGRVIVNASLALHHIQSDSKRSEVIAQIKALNPAAFVLIEPNVNHFEPDFHARFENCYRHYHALFQVIDQLEIPRQDKNALKLFFGREIEDVIGKEEKDRFEKHEPANRWIGRLRENGFSLSPAFNGYPAQTDSGVAIAYQPGGYLGFSVEKEMVLAVMYAC